MTLPGPYAEVIVGISQQWILELVVHHRRSDQTMWLWCILLVVVVVDADCWFLFIAYFVIFAKCLFFTHLLTPNAERPYALTYFVAFVQTQYIWLE